MRTLHHFIAAAFATAVTASCAPCEATIVSAGALDLCPDDGSTVIDSTGGSGSGSGSTASDSTTTVDPTGGGCDLSPGSVWGPCIDGACPNAPASTECTAFASGEVCLPACDDGCPADVTECGGEGVCLPDNVCAPKCITGPEPGCPAGMVCDFSPVGGVCVWP